MNKLMKLFTSLLGLIIMVNINLSTVTAQGEYLVSDELIHEEYPEESFKYEIIQQDVNDFLEGVAAYHNLEVTDFEHSSIPELTMERYSFENESYILSVAQVENSIAYGYTRSEGFVYYDVQNVVKENGLEVSTEDDLSFATREEITQEIDTLIHSLGIELDYSIELQSITANDMSTLLKEYFNFEGGDEEISQIATDLYMASVKFFIDDIPINDFTMGDYEAGIVAEDTVFQLTFSENGIENADLRGYNQVGERLNQINLNAEEIISLIEKKYNNIIILNDTQLSSLDLVYLHLLGSNTDVETEHYFPVWLGIVEQNVDGEIFQNYVFIDAETKKELTLY
ncbi:hypothetical protein HW423_04145 [Aerococcaceae bacterium INB8]|uniref:Uncharacterized protein n=1 Tax=Ruoffia halotolerans TaxID=2748684 RepID=A0A839A4X1_9LACT|nr:hypothetical protein [Ruoffia halotolerans]MBA5728971.1 hypothetical protein [Ruoffia halotolerans]